MLHRLDYFKMCCKFCLAAESAERKVERERDDDDKFDRWPLLLEKAEECGYPAAVRKPTKKNNKRARSDYTKPAMTGRTKLS